MPENIWEHAAGITIAECAASLQRRLGTCVAEFRALDASRRLQKGETLVSAQPFWLESGKCALCIDNSTDQNISLFYFRTGQLVNFLPLLVQCFPIDAHVRKQKVPTAFFSIKALTDCQLTPLDSKKFLAAMLERADINAMIIHSCILNLLNTYFNAYNSPILSNAQRICRLILGTLEGDAEKNIPAYLTHAEISRHLSMHPITVSKIFGKMRSLGIVSKDAGSFVIADLDALRAIAEGTTSITY